jgi:hypothetical protein
MVFCFVVKGFEGRAKTVRGTVFAATGLQNEGSESAVEPHGKRRSLQ